MGDQSIDRPMTIAVRTALLVLRNRAFLNEPQRECARREFAEKFLAAPEFVDSEKININRSRVPLFFPVSSTKRRRFPFFLEAQFFIAHPSWIDHRRSTASPRAAKSQRGTSMRSSARTCRVTYRQVAAADNCIAFPLISPEPRFPHLFLLDTLYCEYACAQEVFHSYTFARKTGFIRMSKL